MHQQVSQACLSKTVFEAGASDIKSTSCTLIQLVA